MFVCVVELVGNLQTGETTILLCEVLYSYRTYTGHGDLNIHKSLGGSISAVLADLETIWGHCISNVLNVPIKDLKFYRVVLLIYDIYNQDYVKKLMNLLLNGLGFGGCFVLQS
ncbi:actin-related protein 8-like isoform X2 [Penaeus vannamei]|uniref:actin-related protein 8-like isoform X2 n=1 Tax=Penaeus vannamei TaxID=6689 RepID=UPI00387F3F9C